MSNNEDEKCNDKLKEDLLADTSELISQETPPGVDRRSFLIRSAVGGAAAVMTGRLVSAEERTAMAIATMPPQAKGSPPPLA
ncbi:MAG TPA: twin-arginine translocation signal domain-containing protein, partial [Vicinamibacterales bacterium]